MTSQPRNDESSNTGSVLASNGSSTTSTSSGKGSVRRSWLYRYLPRPLASQIHWVLLGIFFLVLFICVTVAGMVFMDSRAKAKDRNDPKSDLNNSQVISLNNVPSTPDNAIVIQGALHISSFGPNTGITYNLSLTAAFNSEWDNFNYDSTNKSLPVLPLICVFALDHDSSGTQNVLIVNRTVANNSSVATNLTMDGLTSHYPFDTYTGALDLSIFASATGSFNGNQTCDQLINLDIPSINAVFFVSLGQSLDGLTASVSTDALGDKDGSSVITLDTGSSGTFGRGTITVMRDPVIIAFNVLLFLVMWLLTIATVIAVGQVVTYSCKPRFDLVAASAALLFAMPQLRSAQPGIPMTPTIFDAVGYYWNIGLVGLSTFILIIHFSWQLRHDRHTTPHGTPDEEKALTGAAAADDDD